jgi:predicted RNA-binding protein YlxR (DUF448 family)
MATADQSTLALARKRKAVTRHVPERTCVACRTERPKRHLVRVVRTADSNVEVDRTGRMAGRGAYLCPAQACWRLARARKCLDRALSVALSNETWAALESYAERLPEAPL